jgi:hypothetical protein
MLNILDEPSTDQQLTISVDPARREFIEHILELVANEQFETDNDGQLVLYTGHDSLFELID